jgi:threonine dehydrogenase-like Zn-dependent dehydrogenase
MISTGTERLVASGLVGKAYESHMSVPHMQGGFELPIHYGYSLIVEDTNGRLGHIMHPHQDVIDSRAEDIYWINEEIPAARFSLISNMETIINAIWDSRPTKEDNIAICGFGNIGSLLANTLQVHFGIRPQIIDKDKWRILKAKELGFEPAIDTSFDIIFHTTASANGLQFSIDHLAHEGRVIELSWYGNRKVNLSLGHDFHYKRLQIISSQVSVIPGHMPEESYKSRKDLALSYLKDDSYDQLITNRIPFDETPEFYEQLRNDKQPKGIIYIIDY